MKHIFTTLIFLFIVCSSFTLRPETVAEDSRGRVDPVNYEGAIIVNPLRLEETDGELFLELEVKVDGDAVNRRQSVLIIPELAGEDGNHHMAAGLLISGNTRNKFYNRKFSFGNYAILDNLPDMYIAVTTGIDTLIRYNIQVPYEPWMDLAVLHVHQVLGSPAGKEQLYSHMNVGQVKLQPREPYQVSPKVNYILPAPEQKHRNVQGQAFLDFALGGAVIQPGFRRNPLELEKIRVVISGVHNNPDVTITGLFVEGYASPEGSYASNSKLSQNRADALAAYISQNYGIPSGMIRTSSASEDWDGLRLLVEESTIPRRDEILKIIESQDEPDRKEQRLRAFGTSWSAMNATMFPQLRRVEYQIDFTVKDYSIEEAREQSGRNPELLSHRELFLIARTYEAGSVEEAAAYEMIIRLYPDDPTAIQNYAALLLERGEMATAKRYLNRIADDPAACNNIGVWYLLAGDLETAGNYLRQAQSNGVAEATDNLTELERKRENNELMERYKR